MARILQRVLASCPPGFLVRYTVRAGDTMFRIAQMLRLVWKPWLSIILILPIRICYLSGMYFVFLPTWLYLAVSCCGHRSMHPLVH